ncbi:23653_t:CDS:2 [Cetraspora pellucida]|uniref:23653_t:CDS:1 n=1 Tax=Cetraspora pellucida TaxID=1433469 RepID=A0A9N9HGU6_9GLOM|nr:23653_t:CDS:2 [Cetraspora pellucida]
MADVKPKFVSPAARHLILTKREEFPNLSEKSDFFSSEKFDEYTSEL